MRRTKPLVSEVRNYLVTTISQAKEITQEWLQEIELGQVIDLGLPEVDDRYHVWRVPHARLGFVHELQDMPNHEIGTYLERQLASIPIQDFLIGVTPDELEADAELPDAEEEVEEAVPHGETA